MQLCSAHIAQSAREKPQPQSFKRVVRSLMVMIDSDTDLETRPLKWPRSAVKFQHCLLKNDLCEWVGEGRNDELKPGCRKQCVDDSAVVRCKPGHFGWKEGWFGDTYSFENRVIRVTCYNLHHSFDFDLSSCNWKRVCAYKNSFLSACYFVLVSSIFFASFGCAHYRNRLLFACISHWILSVVEGWRQQEHLP